MKKIFHLETCKTCQKILKELEPLEGIELREIKSKGITSEELEEMYALTESYEALFSRRAMLFRQRGLNNQQLGEEDYKNLILEHYTFLKRPVVLVDNQLFIGNAKKQVEGAKAALH
jgi:arsenate reductase-like glutaredoxin family protein